jgi:hypothetical protein
LDEGILRCGDDLIFNEKNLIDFIKNKKYDFYGQDQSPKQSNGLFSYLPDYDSLKNNNRNSDFMYNYYKKNQSDFSDKNHNLKDLDLEKIKKISIIPKVWGPAGIIYYLSNKSIQILLKHFEKINYDIFYFDKYSNSYPYTIEDVAVTYIMYFNKIEFTIGKHFFGNNDNYIVKHTNYNK